MLNVLIADDDPLILTFLETLIPWTNYGMQVTAKASNGLEALDLISKQPIHVVFTDLQMPQMDGLTFLSKMSTLHTNIAFIVISSYNDFPLVKSCFQYGILDYILKVDLDDLTLLEPLIQKIHDHFAGTSLLSSFTSPATSIHSTFFSLILIKTFNTSLKTRLLLCLETLHDTYPFKECFQEDVLVISFQSLIPSTLTLQTSIVFNQLSTIIDSSHSSCIISIHTMPMQTFNTILNQAVQFCHLAYWYEVKSLKDYHLMESTLSEWEDIFTATLKQIDHLDLSIFSDSLNHLIDYAYTHYISPDTLQKSCYTLFTHLHTQLINYNLINSPAHSLARFNEQYTLNFARLTAFKEWVTHTIYFYTSLIRPDTPEQIYRFLVLYINCHFHDPSLSVDKVSLHLHISPKDLRRACTMYGKTHFKALLNQIRIQKAQQLLLNSTLKIQEVAYRVGYTTIEHFSRSFTKNVGVSPSLFQSHHAIK